MNIRNDTAHEGDALDASLRLGLRGLRQDRQPAHDLWPAIAARLEGAPRRLATDPLRAPAPAWRRYLPLATAASLAIAVGLAWQVRPAGDAASDPAALAISTEARAMTREYEAALQVLGESAAVGDPALRELDRSAAQIRTALSRDPDARFLLDRLQHTYSRRLSLTQRLAGSPTAT